ncbi:helix-turn-helix domain-containing protein [Methanobrevibacter curvatus]|uniref:Cupin domain protein n=1 Tax=Methanobrevibacter curvatus TaxID=49547 RepID=A0A166AMP9_9EURY|nr:cupin domain-containing protein [Methanobrevibacter curvatus]KZX12236.1 cupin domain protein [Methanobrevibacter curvatus]
MKEIIKDIGNRVRELRELSDISVNEMTKKLEIDSKNYESFENGEKDIPVSILFEIAHILKVDMGLFISGEETRMHIFHVTRAGKGRPIEMRKGYEGISLADRFIHKQAETLIVTIDPLYDDKEPVRNSHIGQEFNYVLEGSLNLLIHNQEVILNEGDSIYFDSKYEHAMVPLNNKPAKFLAVII